MIVRIMGEGQFEIDDEVAKGLNDLDEQAGQALEAGDAERFGELLERMAAAVRSNGTRLADEDLSASDAIVPAEDLSLDEARQLFDGEGLVHLLGGFGGTPHALGVCWSFQRQGRRECR